MVGHWHSLQRLEGGDVATAGRVLTPALWTSLAGVATLTYVDLRGLASVGSLPPPPPLSALQRPAADTNGPASSRPQRKPSTSAMLSFALGPFPRSSAACKGALPGGKGGGGGKKI